MRSLRQDVDAGLGLLAIIAIVVVVIVGATFAYAYIAGYGSDDDYVPTLTMTLSARSSGELYDADFEMDVEDPDFIDYFFSTASVDTDAPRVGFPNGDQKVELFVYEEDGEEEFVHWTWNVGNMYDVNGDGLQDSTWKVELPMLRDVAPDDEGAFYLVVRMKVDGSTIGYKRLACNPNAASGE